MGTTVMSFLLQYLYTLTKLTVFIKLSIFKYSLSSLIDNDAKAFKITASCYVQTRLTFICNGDNKFQTAVLPWI
jgi:hypothetical protein